MLLNDQDKIRLANYKNQFDALLEKINALKRRFDQTDDFSPMSVELTQLHASLTQAKNDFFQKTDEVEQKNFASFKLACEVAVTKAEKIFLYEPGIWAKYISPIVRAVLGVVILIAATVLSVGIIPYVCGRDRDIRGVYTAAVFESHSSDNTLIKSRWNNCGVRPTLFGEADKNGLVNEVEEAFVSNHM